MGDRPMRLPTSGPHLVTMLNAFYGPDAARRIIEDRQQALRRSVASSRRADEAKRARRAQRAQRTDRTRSLGWVFRRPQPRHTAFRLEASC